MTSLETFVISRPCGFDTVISPDCGFIEKKLLIFPSIIEYVMYEVLSASCAWKKTQKYYEVKHF
jgi:hypothetical protein